MKVYTLQITGWLLFNIWFWTLLPVDIAHYSMGIQMAYIWTALLVTVAGLWIIADRHLP